MKRVKAKHDPLARLGAGKGLNPVAVHEAPRQPYRQSQEALGVREAHNHSWYHTDRWRRMRQAFLSGSPLCQSCRHRGLLVPAEIADHVIPHKGDGKLFWNKENLQGLCWICHNKKTGFERKGIALDYRADEIREIVL